MYQNEMQGQISVYENDWDGSDPQSVNPDAPADDFNGDDSDDRNDALCSACTTYVASQIVQFQQYVLVNQLGLALGLLAIPVVLPIGLMATVNFTTELTATQALADALQSEVAVNDVICCMVSGLEGQTITQANFGDALDSCGLSGDAELIRAYIAQDLDKLGNFLSFINMLGTAYVASQAGAVVCPCAETETVTYDFTTSDESWDIENGRGVWTNGVGFVSTVQGNRARIAIGFDFPATWDIKQVEFDVDYSSAVTPNSFDIHDRNPYNAFPSTTIKAWTNLPLQAQTLVDVSDWTSAEIGINSSSGDIGNPPYGSYIISECRVTRYI